MTIVLTAQSAVHHFSKSGNSKDDWIAYFRINSIFRLHNSSVLHRNYLRYLLPVIKTKISFSLPVLSSVLYEVQNFDVIKNEFFQEDI